MPRFDVIAFDADDTLWHNERLYVAAQERYRDLLARYVSRDQVEARLYATEVRNLQHFGYGIKAFALSMIETAVEMTDGRVSGRDVQSIIDIAREMLTSDVEVLDHVADTLDALKPRYRLMVITKGDLRDQETKILRSGLAARFGQVEIVSDKTRSGYAAVLARHSLAPERFLMVGNSLRSDILPVLELGGHAVYIPHSLTWAHESAEPPPPERPGFFELQHIGQLPPLLARLETEVKTR
ncbi:MAG: HAD hydrolase-like protein [Anaerolineales bacterium]|nr:HAD hydrolase-like protein [Anaerolineales bacterium]